MSLLASCPVQAVLSKGLAHASPVVVAVTLHALTACLSALEPLLDAAAAAARAAAAVQAAWEGGAARRSQDPQRRRHLRLSAVQRDDASDGHEGAAEDAAAVAGPEVVWPGAVSKAWAGLLKRLRAAVRARLPDPHALLQVAAAATTGGAAVGGAAPRPGKPRQGAGASAREEEGEEEGDEEGVEGAGAEEEGEEGRGGAGEEDKEEEGELLDAVFHEGLLHPTIATALPAPPGVANGGAPHEAASQRRRRALVLSQAALQALTLMVELLAMGGSTASGGGGGGTAGAALDPFKLLPPDKPAAALIPSASASAAPQPLHALPAAWQLAWLRLVSAMQLRPSLPGGQGAGPGAAATSAVPPASAQLLPVMRLYAATPDAGVRAAAARVLRHALRASGLFFLAHAPARDQQQQQQGSGGEPGPAGVDEVLLWLWQLPHAPAWLSLGLDADAPPPHDSTGADADAAHDAGGGGGGGGGAAVCGFLCELVVNVCRRPHEAHALQQQALDALPPPAPASAGQEGEGGRAPQLLSLLLAPALRSCVRACKPSSKTPREDQAALCVYVAGERPLSARHCAHATLRSRFTLRKDPVRAWSWRKRVALRAGVVRHLALLQLHHHHHHHHLSQGAWSTLAVLHHVLLSECAAPASDGAAQPPPQVALPPTCAPLRSLYEWLTALVSSTSGGGSVAHAAPGAGSAKKRKAANGASTAWPALSFADSSGGGGGAAPAVPNGHPKHQEAARGEEEEEPVQVAVRATKHAAAALLQQQQHQPGAPGPHPSSCAPPVLAARAAAQHVAAVSDAAAVRQLAQDALDAVARQLMRASKGAPPAALASGSADGQVGGREAAAALLLLEVLHAPLAAHGLSLAEVLQPHLAAAASHPPLASGGANGAEAPARKDAARRGTAAAVLAALPGAWLLAARRAWRATRQLSRDGAECVEALLLFPAPEEEATGLQLLACLEPEAAYMAACCCAAAARGGATAALLRSAALLPAPAPLSSAAAAAASSAPPARSTRQQLGDGGAAVVINLPAAWALLADGAALAQAPAGPGGAAALQAQLPPLARLARACLQGSTHAHGCPLAVHGGEEAGPGAAACACARHRAAVLSSVEPLLARACSAVCADVGALLLQQRGGAAGLGAGGGGDAGRKRKAGGGEGVVEEGRSGGLAALQGVVGSLVEAAPAMRRQRGVLAELALRVLRAVEPHLEPLQGQQQQQQGEEEGRARSHPAPHLSALLASAVRLALAVVEPAPSASQPEAPHVGASEGGALLGAEAERRLLAQVQRTVLRLLATLEPRQGEAQALRWRTLRALLFLGRRPPAQLHYERGGEEGSLAAAAAAAPLQHQVDVELVASCLVAPDLGSSQLLARLVLTPATTAPSAPPPPQGPTGPQQQHQGSFGREANEACAAMCRAVALALQLSKAGGPALSSAQAGDGGGRKRRRAQPAGGGPEGGEAGAWSEAALCEAVRRLSAVQAAAPAERGTQAAKGPAPSASHTHGKKQQQQQRGSAGSQAGAPLVSHRQHLALLLPVVAQCVSRLHSSAPGQQRGERDGAAQPSLVELYREPLLAYMQRRRRKDGGAAPAPAPGGDASAASAGGEQSVEGQVAEALHAHALPVLRWCLAAQPVEEGAAAGGAAQHPPAAASRGHKGAPAAAAAPSPWAKLWAHLVPASGAGRRAEQATRTLVGAPGCA